MHGLVRWPSGAASDEIKAGRLGHRALAARSGGQTVIEESRPGPWARPNPFDLQSTSSPSSVPINFEAFILNLIAVLVMQGVQK